MPAPEVVRQLVQRFDEHKHAYLSPTYNEAQLRQEFLNPFFEALGWDVANKQGYAVQYREVIHEDSIHIKGSANAKAPDYAFRLGGVRKFFVEAKKPAEDIENTKEYAYQLKIYAWSLGLPLSILTDFKGFAVYDCRSKPNRTDSPATGRIMYITYDQYVDRWDEIAGIFSPDAIRKGAFDQYAEDNTAKKGTIKVDDAFLQEIETWRTLLARNIALRNEQITNERQLNFAVQMTISRIIFLRISEDRGIEPQNQLLELGASKDIYPRLVALYMKADQKYNSGLFHFKAEAGDQNSVDAFTPTLVIDDKVLKTIIKSLYYPSPYVFKEIPVEILGQVYERFLGKVIRLTPGRQAKIEEKPEVRKAGGVYYTPKYIVDYIVENTVGKLLEDKTPEEAARLKILDPACGSGSFLLGAFQHLMDWHEGWYLGHNPEGWTRGKQPALIHTAEGDWRLTTEEKKRILLNNIYGVDIDAQAVEVTKLSLLLKVLEEETGQLTLGFERALPDLGENIKCGNALIGWDYFEGQLIPDEKEVERVNPFDWEKNFPMVFASKANGGFDAVIGNPPYVRSNNMEINQKNYWKKTPKFTTVTGKFDVYVLFIERSIQLLLPNGVLGFIVPYPILSQKYASLIRKFILENCRIKNIVDVSEMNVFTANVSTCILILQKECNKRQLISNRIVIQRAKESFLTKEEWHVTQRAFENTPDNMFRLNITEQVEKISKKVWEVSKKFSDYCYIGIGMDLHDSKTGLDKSARIFSEPLTSRCKPYVEGKDISRYGSPKWYRYVDYLPKKMHRPKYPEMFETQKIIVQVVVGREGIIATYDDEFLYAEQSLIVCVPKHVLATTGFKDTNATKDQINLSMEHNLKFLLGILCSKLINWYFVKFLSDELHVVPENLRQLPIRNINPSITDDVKAHDQIVKMVEYMLDLHKRNPQTPHDKQRLQREIEATDARIDRLVYELYGLTDEEIRIVEGEG